MSRDLQIVATLQMRALGPDEVKKAKSAKDDSTEIFQIGTVFGECRGLSYRNNPQDEGSPSIALTGVFEGIPADPDMPILRSTRLYLPKAVHDVVVAAVRGDAASPVDRAPKRGQAVDTQGNTVPLLVEIGCRHTKSEVAFEYVCRLPRQLQGVDPLARLREEFKLPQLALPAPGGDSEAESGSRRTGNKRKAA